jgi:hypothetical protein
LYWHGRRRILDLRFELRHMRIRHGELLLQRADAWRSELYSG